MNQILRDPRRSIGLGWLLIVASVVAGPAADVAYFGVIKSVQYTQAVGSAVSPIAADAFTFNSFAIGAATGVVTDATVTIPGGATRQLSTNLGNGPIEAFIKTLMPDSDLVWVFTAAFSAQSALDSAYPSEPGSLIPFRLPSEYTVNMSTVNDGQQSQKLSYVLTSTPPTPQVSNLAAAQDIDTRAPFTLTWNSLGGALDVVLLVITDVNTNPVYTSPAPFSDGALTGQSNRVEIPPQLLPPGTNLTGHLLVAKPGLPNTNYTFGIIGHLRDTAFPLATRALPAPLPPQFTAPAMTNGLFLVQLAVEPDRVYWLQGSEDLKVWSLLLMTNATGGSILFGDPQTPFLQRRFYRVVSP